MITLEHAAHQPSTVCSCLLCLLTGFTTNGTAATQAVDTDCRLAEGYGVANGAVGLCPVGECVSAVDVRPLLCAGSNWQQSILFDGPTKVMLGLLGP